MTTSTNAMKNLMVCPVNLLAATCMILCISNGDHYARGFSQLAIPGGLQKWPRPQQLASAPLIQIQSQRSHHVALHQSSQATTKGTSEDVKLSEREIDESMEYLAKIITHQLEAAKEAPANNDDSPTDVKSINGEERDTTAYELAKGRFVDLTTTIQGEQLLENLFLQHNHLSDNSTITTSTTTEKQIHIIKHAITSLQSLLIYGMQIGVKGSEESQMKMVRHLFRAGDPPPEEPGTWIESWTSDSIRRLKFHRDTNLGKLLLAKLIRKRTAQGAFDLLVDMGVWDIHEDTALLRSGFPVRFMEEELEAAREAQKSTRDVDDMLGIRTDLRHQKVYTIDGASTLDIDDGISVEVLDDDDDDSGKPQRYRYWIHIADVDRWAGRGSKLLEVAERRGTSLYLPTMTLSMFPPNMESMMSLESWEDKCALSLGVELDPDGSIIPSSIIITPSLIHVDYRLTYEQVDEMLDEGVGYTEEWQIGALLEAATRRRSHRVGKGSTEGMVPFPIPQAMVTTKINPETREHDIELKIETTHNSGANVTTEGVCDDDVHYDPYCSPVSSSQLLVTEMMILAGEAIGTWQKLQPMQKETSGEDGCFQLPNVVELPFRRQPGPDFKSRASEARQMDLLLENNKRYPHAWYARRFFNKVSVSEEPGPHYGMGLDSYVQWTSPIRRLTDLKVHSALKRYLRRKRVNNLLKEGLTIPADVSSVDLGYDISKIQQQTTSNDKIRVVDPIDYTSGLGMIFAGRPIQSSSSNYWLFEYIRRLVHKSDKVFESIVLGCVNPDRFQYAIYVYELGLEHRYLSESGELEIGKKLWLKVSSVNPRMELLTFSLASRSGGIA